MSRVDHPHARGRGRWPIWLLVALVGWSLFAVGGVYRWASTPIVIGGVVLAAAFRPRIAASAETRVLDRALIASLGAIALQIVPVPSFLLGWISPHTETVRATLLLGSGEQASWIPISLAPAATVEAVALVAAAMIVFWTARQLCAQGAAGSIVQSVAIIGLLAGIAAIIQQAEDPKLIYGRWLPRDHGALPFGSFVNRNHFATWVLMAFPLALTHVIAAVKGRRTSRRLAGEMAAVLQGLGTGVAWVAVAAGVMTLALIASASRSGVIGLAVSLVVVAGMAQHRLDRASRLWGLAAVAVVGGLVFAYANLEPLVWRVEETLAVGTGERSQVWRDTVRMGRDFWTTGVGVGSFQRAMLIYQQMDRAKFVNQAHNQYLQLLAEGGLLVAIPVVVAAAAFLHLFIKRFRADQSSLIWARIGGMTALVAVLVQNFWETGLRMPANGILFALAAAIAVHRPASVRADKTLVP